MSEEQHKKEEILKQNIEKCRDQINQQYLAIEKDIDARTEKLIEDLKKSRDSLKKQLNEHKEQALEPLNSLLPIPNKEIKNVEHALTKVDDIKKNIEKPNIRFVKSNLKLDRYSFLGKLVNVNEKKKFEFLIDLKKFGSFKYGIPFKCNNIVLAFFPDSTFIKVVEESLYDNFQFTLNIDLFDNNKLVRKISESIGAFRLKKVVTNKFNNFFLVLISNKFNEFQDYLKLYDENFTLFKTKGLGHTPKNILMCDKFVYLIKQNNQIEKYDFKFNLLTTYSVQTSERSAAFYMPKNYYLMQAQNDRLFCVDLERSKIKLISERNGKVMKSFEIELNREYCLVQTDSNDLIYVLNRKNLKLEVYNLDGILIVQKRVDAKRIEEIDNFYAFSDQSISIVDRKNHLVLFI